MRKIYFRAKFENQNDFLNCCSLLIKKDIVIGLEFHVYCFVINFYAE